MATKKVKIQTLPTLVTSVMLECDNTDFDRSGNLISSLQMFLHMYPNNNNLCAPSHILE